MAKFTRFDSRNKKKGKHKSYSREEKDFRIKNPEMKRKIKIDVNALRKRYHEYIDPTEDI
jgi:uncharacterized protein YtpQ (UPF0354 family)